MSQATVTPQSFAASTFDVATVGGGGQARMGTATTTTAATTAVWPTWLLCALLTLLTKLRHLPRLLSTSLNPSRPPSAPLAHLSSPSPLLLDPSLCTATAEQQVLCSRTDCRPNNSVSASSIRDHTMTRSSVTLSLIYHMVPASTFRIRMLPRMATPITTGDS